MLLHSDRQQETRNADRQAHQGQCEQLPKNVAKKLETLTVKQVVPNVNWIAQTKVGIK
jgi:hypothetical protein